MLTVRNEHEPFVGRAARWVFGPTPPTSLGFADWQSTTLESPLAEVVWYAVENPELRPTTRTDSSANRACERFTAARS